MNDASRTLFPRFAAGLVTTALKDTPVVMVAGPRQSGKTTLVRDLVAGNREFINQEVVGLGVMGCRRCAELEGGNHGRE